MKRRDRNVWIIIVSTFIVALCLGSRVSACSCIPQEFSDAVKEANEIFIGTVTNITNESGKDIMTVQVLSVLKGNIPEKEIEVVGLNENKVICCICQYGYKVGDTYLMNSTESENGLLKVSTDSCDMLNTKYDQSSEISNDSIVLSIRSQVKRDTMQRDMTYAIVVLLISGFVVFKLKRGRK